MNWSPVRKSKATLHISTEGVAYMGMGGLGGRGERSERNEINV